MSFPKISRTISKELEHVKVQFLTESLELILDRTKCIGCGTCARVCPKDAISRGPVGASRRFPTLEDIIPEVYDPKKCVFCGTCVYFCPTSCLTLKIDGETVNIDDIQIVKEHVVPKLEFEAKKVTSLDGIERVVKQSVVAKVVVKHEDCPGGCATCAEVCPSSTIIIGKRPEKGWESYHNVEVDEEDKCIACGACDNGCPTGAIQLEITELKTSGEFSELFWNPLVERLKTFRWNQPTED